MILAWLTTLVLDTLVCTFTNPILMENLIQIIDIFATNTPTTIYRTSIMNYFFNHLFKLITPMQTFFKALITSQLKGYVI